MNRARASAQHHGQHADKAQLNQWVTAADVFVRSLIASQFGIDLRNAVAASAIADQGLREQLSAAEEALYGGRITEAVQLAAKAFDQARSRWRRQLKQIDSRSADTRPAHQPDRFDEIIGRLDDLEEVRHFAPDATGHLRVNHLVRVTAQGDDDLPVSAEEAEQVLGFVLGWILRWEAVSTTFDGDRLQRHWASLRPPATSTPELGARVDLAHGVITTRPASIGFLGPVDPERPIFAAELQIVDAPDHGFRLWSHMLEVRIRERWTPQMPSGQVGSTGSWQMNAVEVNPRGLVTLSAPEAEFDLNAVVATVSEAVSHANEALVQRNESLESWQDDHEGLATPYEQALADLEFQGHKVVSNVQVIPVGELSIDAFGVPEPIVLIQVSPELLSLIGLDKQTLLRELPQLSIDQDGAIRVRHDLEPAQIALALLAALERAAEQNQGTRAAAQKRLERKAAYRAALLHELNRADEAGDHPGGGESD